MGNALAKKAAEIAAEFHGQGYNCAESIILTFRKYITPELSEDFVRLATPFGAPDWDEQDACAEH